MDNIDEGLLRALAFEARASVRGVTPPPEEEYEKAVELIRTWVRREIDVVMHERAFPAPPEDLQQELDKLWEAETGG